MFNKALNPTWQLVCTNEPNAGRKLSRVKQNIFFRWLEEIALASRRRLAFGYTQEPIAHVTWLCSSRARMAGHLLWPLFAFDRRKRQPSCLSGILFHFFRTLIDCASRDGPRERFAGCREANKEPIGDKAIHDRMVNGDIPKDTKN